jgi:dGTPase
MRSEFQRDRDRILHTKAFRRLKHKTQVFIAPLGDHYATRLTHTLEVAQIARTIARALNLNEDLTEAIALGHDLGHTPFGHVGEDELNDLYPGGYRHSQQSLRIVDQLEKEGRGLNLTWEVRQGILRHSKPRGDFLEALSVEDLSLEAQICRISDAVAYLNHDLADAFRAGVMSHDRLPDEIAEVLGTTHAERINTMVSDIIAASWPSSGVHGDLTGTIPTISMGKEVKSAFYTLREFMFDSVYIPTDNSPQGQGARAVMRLLYSHLDNNRHEIPPEYDHRSRSEDEAVVDFISGMTDHYALRVAEGIEPGITLPFEERSLN